MEFWATFAGSAFGVIAGVLVQYLVQMLFNWKTLSQQKSSFRKEMEYNKAVTSDLVTEVGRLRNAVNGRVLHAYNGYFAPSRAFWAQTVQLANNGSLYGWLSVDNMKRLQKVISLLSSNNESWLNTEIAKRRATAERVRPS